jgi:polysaccharide export outer membrane protein
MSILPNADNWQRMGYEARTEQETFMIMHSQGKLPVRPFCAGVCLIGLFAWTGADSLSASEPDKGTAWRAAGSPATSPISSTSTSPSTSPSPAQQVRLGPPVATPRSATQPQAQTSRRNAVVEEVFAQIERESKDSRPDRPAQRPAAVEGKNLVVRAQAPQGKGEEIYLPPPPPIPAGGPAPPIEPVNYEAGSAMRDGNITKVSLPVVMSPTVAGHSGHGDHQPPHYTGSPGSAPHECAKSSLPPYVIEPPDILMLQIRKGVPDVQLPAQVLVRPDGTISLGLYGSVPVAGLTIDQARVAIEKYLARKDNRITVANPEVAVDVFAYNSKFYYVVTDGGGYGEQVIRIPITGNETVLDAISQINGLPAVASKKHIWLARSNCWTGGMPEVLPVRWNDIVQRGEAQSNYQVMPGDRIYVRSDKLVRFDSAVAKVISPFERMFGFTLLGNTTIQNLRVGKRGGTSGF